MPVKSILDIEVNDASFKQFNALFQKYQTALKSTPLQWRNIAQAQQQGVKGFRDLVLEQAQAIGQQRLLAEAHKAALNLLRQEESSWQRIKRQTTGAATNIRDMTGQLQKWAGFTAVFSGLLGAGGLFGISRLAEGVAGGRRSSLGLGTTYGGQRAFATAFDRFGDPGAILSGVAGAKGDVTKRVAFSGAGMTDKDLVGDNATVAARLIAKVQQLAKSTPDAMLANVLHSRHLDELGITPEYARTLKSTSAEEMATQQSMFRKFSRDYGVGSNEQRAYQDFSTALNDAGNRIETVFVKGLVPLIPGMEKLSNSIVKSIENLAKAIPPDAMERIGKGIETFAQYLGSEKFQGDVKAFAGAVAWIAGKVKTLGIWATDDSPKADIHVAAKRLRVAHNKKMGWGERFARDNKDTALGHLLGLSPNIKPGAGTIDPGLGAFASSLNSKIPGINRFTSFNDDYHKGTGSAHADGRAFDFTIKNPADHAAVADLVRSEMARQGIKGKVIDEYANPSSRATAPHIHVQTDVRVSNATGSNLVVQAQQVTPSP